VASPICLASRTTNGWSPGRRRACAPHLSRVVPERGVLPIHDEARL